MNLREAILEEHSKARAERIARFIGHDSERFDQLMQLIFEGEYRIVQRGTWALRKVCDKHPELFFPYFEKAVFLLREDRHVAFRRNVLSIIAEQEIPEDYLGELADICFGFLESRSETVAVRVHAMEILAAICRREPELANELILLIETYLPHESPGFKSRGKKILNRLKKL